MKRAVITGLGAITPIGIGIRKFWESALDGKSGSRPIEHFDVSNIRTQFACQIPEFDSGAFLDHKTLKVTDRFCQYALIAADEAIADSGFDRHTLNPSDIGVIFGSGQGGMQTFEDEVSSFHTGISKRYNPYFVPKIITNMAAGMISIVHGFMGINYTPVSACATGNTALMEALNNIRLGNAKIIIAGGAEAGITQASMYGFSSMRAMSSQNDSPETASQPFDANRDGFVMGEGAGAIVVEEYGHAKKRNARIYAELVGAAMTADAFHMTATHPEGLGAIIAMRKALMDATLHPEQIDYLNAHATSTPVGDVSEIKAILEVFGESKNLSVSATKSMTGHLLGAAAAIEAILCVKGLQENKIPPTINTKNLDKAIPRTMDIVLSETRQKPIQYVMSNAFGFGGHNSSVIFKSI